MTNNNLRNYTKLQVTLTLVLVLSFFITGATYAYFAISAYSDNVITGNTATVNLTLSVNQVFPTEASDNTGVLVPQLSTPNSEASPLSTALKSGCVDANKNIVCQVYKISITNDGGTATQVVDGSVSFYSDQNLTSDAQVAMPNLRWKLVNTVNETTPANSILGTTPDLVANFNENIFVDDLTMITDSSFEYYMIIWINETTTDQPTDEGKSFYGKVSFNSSNGTGVTSTFTT